VVLPEHPPLSHRRESPGGTTIDLMESKVVPVGFARHVLEAGHYILAGELPESLLPLKADFEALWRMHPTDYEVIKMRGRPVQTPRWQQAYGMDYFYTGHINRALPTPSLLLPLLAWARETVDPRLNGLLLNWYDGALGHYIGPHSDSTVNMIAGAPIVTISFGEDRIFRLRPRGGGAHVDFTARNGQVFVMPYDANKAYKHEVPKSAKCTGRRISVTLRGLRRIGPPG
jgi:alkylated DNA repair dioxygenase AlkB